MQEISITQRVNAPIEEVWAVVADFGNAAEWNPNLRDSFLVGEQSSGIGAERQCDLNDGKNFVRERIVQWDEGRGMTVDVYDGTMPFEKAQATIVLEPTVDGHTLVRLGMRFVPRGGALGKVAASVFIKPMMRRLFGRLGEGLREHVEKRDAANTRSTSGASRVAS